MPGARKDAEDLASAPKPCQISRRSVFSFTVHAAWAAGGGLTGGAVGLPRGTGDLGAREAVSMRSRSPHKMEKGKKKKDERKKEGQKERRTLPGAWEAPRRPGRHSNPQGA